jgi:branched-chain amino acid aminotransferase
VIELAGRWGVNVREQKIAIDSVLEAHRTGTLAEVFGSGTAAVISPVGQLKYEEHILTIGEGRVGPMAQKLFDAVTDVQYGRAEDVSGWIETVP